MSQRTMMWGFLAAAAILVIMIVSNIVGSEEGKVAADNAGDITYATVEELNTACQMSIAVPEGATDVVYSSSSPDGKAIARADYTYDGRQCWFIQKITMYYENISGVSVDAQGTSKYTSNGKEWTLEWNSNEGMAFLYDAAHGWMMNIAHVEGDGIDEQVMQALVDGCQQ